MSIFPPLAFQSTRIASFVAEENQSGNNWFIKQTKKTQSKKKARNSTSNSCPGNKEIRLREKVPAAISQQLFGALYSKLVNTSFSELLSAGRITKQANDERFELLEDIQEFFNWRFILIAWCNKFHTINHNFMFCDVNMGRTRRAKIPSDRSPPASPHHWHLPSCQ